MVTSRVRSRVRHMVTSRVRSRVRHMVTSRVRSRVRHMVTSRVRSRVRHMVTSRVRSRVRVRFRAGLGLGLVVNLAAVFIAGGFYRWHPNKYGEQISRVPQLPDFRPFC